MNNETRHNILEHVGRFGSVITPVGICVLLLLQTQFVSRKEFSESYEKTTSRVEAIEKVLVQMNEANKINDRQDIELADHEARIRNLEKVHEP